MKATPHELCIAEKVTLPVEFLSLRNVLFGGSGAGKTTFGRVIFEEANKLGVPCGVIDLKADWWGLKSSADGKADGIPVIIFGGEHADVPIDENGGAELAEIVAELRQPFIVDLEELSKAKQLKFLAPFFDRLYDKNRHPLKLICDEADRYIPQRIITKDPNAAICLGAGEDIAKRGRKHGIFPMFISQRNADLNKSVTELCDVATVFRTSGPNDQRAVEDWFHAKGNLITPDQRETVMTRISGLENGEAIICSAHPHLKLFLEVHLRLPVTFDSSATPAIGQELIQPKKLAQTDLTALSERMRATIQKAKENSPDELKRRIRELEKQLVNPKVEIRPAEVIKEVPVLTDDDRARLKKGVDACDVVVASFEKLQAKTAESIADMRRFFEPLRENLISMPAGRGLRDLAGRNAIRRPAPAGVAKPVKIPDHRHPEFGRGASEPNHSNGKLTGTQQAILGMVLMLGIRGLTPNREMIARWLDIHPNGGRYGTDLKALRESGYLDDCQLTDEGVEDAESLDTGIDALKSVLSGTQRAIVEVLEDGSTHDRETLAAVLGLHPNGGRYGTDLKRLRTMGVIPDRGEIKLTEAATK